MLSEDVAAKLCTKSSSFFVASTAPSVLKTRGAQHHRAPVVEEALDVVVTITDFSPDSITEIPHP